MEEKEELILKLRKEGLGIKRIAKELKIWVNTVNNILKKYNLNKALKPKELIEKEKLVLKYYQEGMTTRDIAKKLQMGRGTISRVLKENNLGGRKIKYKFDETIFDNIDNEIKAYFIGLLYSDGNISGRDNAIVFELKGSDSLILEQLSQFIFKDNLVKYYERPEYKDGYIAKLSIYSKRVKEKLIEFGYHNKILVLKFPEKLNSELYNHFIRGYFDGRGCIYHNYKDGSFSMIGTLEFLIEISNIFNNLKIDNTLKYISNTNNTYSLHVRRRVSLDLLYNYLYDNATIFFIRKKEHFLNWKIKYNTPKIKKVIPEELINKVKELFDQDLGSRKIAKELNINRKVVQKIYKKLGVYNIGRKKPKSKIIITQKTCKKCGEEFPIEKFRARPHKNGSIYYESTCLKCEKLLFAQRIEEFFKNNPDWHKNYRENNLDRIRAYDKEYREKNKEILSKKAYARRNKYKIENPSLFLGSHIATVINSAIKNNYTFINRSDEDLNLLKALPYTIEELKDHLEKQFEPWMNWGNWGRYISKDWDDNDTSTWKWQIDHIIPQSLLPYDKAEDENFKICWSLNNLRPLSAKQNLLDGVTKSRHKKYD